ncbi:hypothetical protein [Kribbella sp. CA-293567]|uniref:hypothetical protein n=1 Tax=Kribbella sp. CA-293567 TaxID=3002436 RepID=UPI0022DE4915|nr:hypothetical protein [Kribbella sp. CA-293567]WBQ03224.1 hypothetical protein OX958_24965 [Kribbella sp. CA-293567]
MAYRKLLRPEPTQALVGQWLGLTQGQVSRIERSATPVRDIDKLDRWAQALHIPEQLLWFSITARPATLGEQGDLTAPPASADYDGQHSVDAYPRSDVRSIVQTRPLAEADGVHRRQFIKSAGAGLTAVGASLLVGTAASLNQRRSRERPAASTEIREMTQVFRRLDNRYGGVTAVRW